MQLAFHFFAMLFIVIYQERLSFFQKGCVADFLPIRSSSGYQP